MTWPLTVALLGVLASAVASVGLWLRARSLALSETSAELTRRLDRLEGEVRTARVAPQVAAGPTPLGVYGRAQR